MSYPFLIIFALLPSFIWLLFYLRKDSHPESNSMILKIFFFVMLSAIPAIFIELGFGEEISGFNLSPFLAALFNVFVGVALTEEILKYAVVKKAVLNNPEFDEPVDAMLYMIIAALGFVALENLLIFLSPETYFFQFGETLALAALRFISATFLHALTSGILGYFMALSFFEAGRKSAYLLIGFSAAVILHGLYNFSIMVEGGSLRFIMPTMIIVALAIFVSLGFKRLKRLASVCKIK
jgi:RsiW-degrading membrane proteinase PrsW (M82 family)